MSAEKRLVSFKRLLSHLRERLELDLGFVLWDGSTVPAGLAPGALALQIADEGAVAALVRRPKLDTIMNLWVAGRVDLRNGSLFDVVARRPKVRTKEFLRVLDKKLAVGVAAKFLFVPRGGPWPLEKINLKGASDGSESENKGNIQFHYDVSNDFYALILDPEMVYSCAYFADWADDLDTAQRSKLDMSCRRAAPETRRSLAGYRLRLGRAHMSCRPALRGSRPWRDAVAKTIQLRQGKNRAA